MRQSGGPPGRDGRDGDATWSGIDWAWIRGRIMASTGWTPAFVRHKVGLRDMHDLFEYWKDAPPVHESLAALVAGLAGKSGSRSAAPKGKGDNPAALLGQANSCGLPGRRAGRVPSNIRKLIHADA